jgi:hypothetical protein
MKRLVILSVMLIYLFGSTQVGQLVKLPILVQHYFEHKAENPGISLLSFLQIHYNDKTVIDDDYEKDMQLPFKVIDNNTLTAFNNLPPQKMEWQAKSLMEHCHFFTPYHPNFTAQSTCGDIFQPPKKA